MAHSLVELSRPLTCDLIISIPRRSLPSPTEVLGVKLALSELFITLNVNAGRPNDSTKPMRKRYPLITDSILMLVDSMFQIRKTEPLPP
jgi:hypothetical protein